MDARIAVYTSWFIFAIWIYIVLIYTISFLYFWRVKTKNAFYDRRALTIDTIIFSLNLVGQIFTVFLYIDQGKNLMTTNASTTTEYWILLSLNLFLVICYLVFFLVFTNNLAVKMTDTKLYLMGISVLNSAFIRATKNKDGSFVLEYVYKHEGEKKWTEKLKFYSFFGSTKYIINNYTRFFDPEKNLAFFNLHRVTKKDDTANNANKSDQKTEKGSIKLEDATNVTSKTDRHDAVTDATVKTVSKSSPIKKKNSLK